MFFDFSRKNKIIWKNVGVRRTEKIKSPQNAKNDEKTLDFWRCFWRAKRAENFQYFESNIEQILAVFEDTKKQVCIDFLVYCIILKKKRRAKRAEKIWGFGSNWEKF